MERAFQNGESLINIVHQQYGCQSVISGSVNLAKSLFSVAPDIGKSAESTEGQTNTGPVQVEQSDIMRMNEDDLEAIIDNVDNWEHLDEIVDEKGDNLTAIMQLLLLNVQQSAPLNEQFLKDNPNNQVMEDGLMYENTVVKGRERKLLTVPNWFLSMICRSLHTSGAQFSGYAAARILKLAFSNPNIELMAKMAHESCGACLIAGISWRKRVTGPSSSKELQPGSSISLDFLESLPPSDSGHRNLLVAVCQATSFVILLPQKKLTQANTVESLITLLNIFPNLIELCKDGGQAFSGKFADMLIQYGIRHVYPGPKSQSNGQSEVHVRCLKEGGV